MLLSSQHLGEGRLDQTKPEIVTYYNSTKGGVDTLDKLISTYTCKRRTRRWPMVVFSFLIDTAAVNAFVVYTSLVEYQKNKSHRRRLFLFDLGCELIKDFADYTKSHSQMPPIRLNRTSIESTKRGRCKSCPRSLDRKATTKCSACTAFICKDHVFCDACC